MEEPGELTFLPMRDPRLSLYVPPVEVSRIASSEMKELYDKLHAFAMGRTARIGETRPRRLVGVSANQVGINQAFVYVNVTEEGEWTDNLRLLVNPQITRVWGEHEVYAFGHACFSTGSFTTVQLLPRFMEVEYYDRNGMFHCWTIDGERDGTRQLHVVWHEIQHTIGLRHTDFASQRQQRIFVVHPDEMRAFGEGVMAGNFGWHRHVPPEAWARVLEGREWESLIQSTNSVDG